MTREEAITRLKNMAWLYGSAEREQNIEAIDMAIEALQADSVKVVRCKDCKWYESSGLPCPLDPCESLGDDGFCSCGKRKGGAE